MLPHIQTLRERARHASPRKKFDSRFSLFFINQSAAFGSGAGSVS